MKMTTEEQKRFKTLNIITGVALVIAIIPIFPYGFYQLLRWFVTGVSVYNAYVANKAGNQKLTGIFAIIAILFNPIVPIFLSRGVWFFVDIIVAIIFFVSINKLLGIISNGSK